MESNQILERKKAQKLIFVDAVFLILDFVITFLIFKLWFWLFTNKFILTILLAITLAGFVRQVSKGLTALMKHWRQMSPDR